MVVDLIVSLWSYGRRYFPLLQILMILVLIKKGIGVKHGVTSSMLTMRNYFGD
jgi:hypothetical protein